MSVKAPARPELRDDDGGNELHWRKWSAETDGMESYVAESTARLAAGAAMEGYSAEDFSGSDDTAHQLGFRVIQQVNVGSDNYIG